MTQDSHDSRSESQREPSVLDYLKSRLSFGRGERIQIPAPAEEEGKGEPSTAENPVEAEASAGPRSRGSWSDFPWRSLLALGLALTAQSFYEPPALSAAVGSILYLFAAGFLVWAALRNEWQLSTVHDAASGTDPLSYRRTTFLLSIPIAVFAFLLFTGNLFTFTNLAFWLIALGLFIRSLWLDDPEKPSLWRRMRAAAGQSSWQIKIDRRTLLLLAVAAVLIFFRVYHIQQTPAEPFSDHAEKLLDVYDVSQGQTHIFFPRNTGREAIQMYWTLIISWIFGTGISFLSLKIGTVLIGLFTLPYIYLLGREVGGPRVGLLACVLAGVGYWPNLIARIGLRFPLYPMFVAPLMFYLIRGLRTRNRNDFILAGIFLGLGMHGYSPFRIVPLLVISAVVLFVLHAQSRGARQSALLWLVITGLTSLIIFLPLLRYATENSDSFLYRALTRLGPIEQPLPAPWYQVFASNTWNAIRMFNWNNGSIWVHSVPDRPALDVVAGALFVLGVVLLLVRYVRQRHWMDVLLLLSVPILLLPSILSLAFPDENPSLNRTAGALVPVFVIIAMALDGLIASFGTRPGRVAAAYVLAGILLWGSASQSYDLVFHEFDRNFRNNSWNSSEMGAVIKEFGLAYGETDTAWVVPFPYWVDTRLVGMWAGIPNRDFAMWPDQLPQTEQDPGPKLFIVKASLTDPTANDQKSVDLLRQLYPQGSLGLHRSPVAGHDFWVYFVPALSTP